MSTTKLQVKGTYKESHAADIKNCLMALDGVEKVTLDLDKKIVTVEHDSSFHDGSDLGNNVRLHQ